MMKFLRALLTAACRFLRGHRGGATGFAAAAVVMMMLGGAALITDHVWLVGKRDLLQSAADAASVATTQRLATLPGSMTDAEIHAELLPIAERYARLNVLANTGEELEPDDVTVTLVVDRAAGVVDVRVAADLGDTLLSKWLYDYGGPGNMEARAGAEFEAVPAEVVLALDTTASMANNAYRGARNRLEVVRQAARDLVDLLSEAGGERVAVGLVPWGSMVRLDSETRQQWHREGWAVFAERRRYREPYRRLPRRGTADPLDQTIPRAARGSWQGCVGAARVEDGLADLPLRDAAMALPENRPFAEAYAPSWLFVTYQCFGASPPTDLWSQVCWDQDSADGQPGPPFRQSYFAGSELQGSCGEMSPLRPLSTDADAVGRAIDDLTVAGARTYSGLGVEWGRRMLDPAWRSVWGDPVHPVDPAAPEHRDVRKVLVLLTDGEDNVCTRSRVTDPDCQRPSRVAVSRSEACEDAKAAGIEIFVVAPMDARRERGNFARNLRACASSVDHVYINNPDAPALRQAFRDIATRVSMLRRVY